MRKIIIGVSGGIVQEILSTEKKNDALTIYVVDWDNIKGGDIDEISEFPMHYINRKELDAIIKQANMQIEENRKAYGE